MIMKAAHAIGRQGKVGIIGLSRLLNGRSGHTPDLDVCVTNGGGLVADEAIPLALGPAGMGIGLGQVCPGPGRLKPARLQVERIPAQAQSMSHNHDQPQDQRGPKPRHNGSIGLHRG